jgi:hypothetical protein
MRHINVVAILVLFGPRVQEMVKSLTSATKRDNWSSFEGRDNADPKDSDVICTTSPLQAAGAIVRLAAFSTSSARAYLKDVLAPLESEFGCRPFNAM